MRTIPLVALGEKLVNACTASHGVWRSTAFILFCMERSKSHRTNGISRHPCRGFLFIFFIFFIFVYNRLWRCADDRLCPPDGIFRSTLHVDASGVYREHPHQHIGAISSCPLPPPYKNDLSCHPVRGVLLSRFTSLQPTSHVSATVARFLQLLAARSCDPITFPSTIRYNNEALDIISAFAGQRGISNRHQRR
jgi:hypothetical protein